MVELLTDYTTQIYHALSTDARPNANPGAQLREIDTGKRFIFDGSAWNELPDGGGGGGGGGVSVLVAEYTADSDVSQIVLTADFSQYRIYALQVAGQFSAREYLYTKLNTSTDAQAYSPEGGATSVDMILCVAASPSGARWGIIHDHRSLSAVMNLNTITLYLYDQASLFKAGFNVKLWGWNM